MSIAAAEIIVGKFVVMTQIEILQMTKDYGSEVDIVVGKTLVTGALVDLHFTLQYYIELN